VENFTDNKAPINFDQMPDENGHFGPYGGRFVSETLVYAQTQIFRRMDQNAHFHLAFDRN
jgi:tryptophan synthase beta chain